MPGLGESRLVLCNIFGFFRNVGYVPGGCIRWLREAPWCPLGGTLKNIIKAPVELVTPTTPAQTQGLCSKQEEAPAAGLRLKAERREWK